MMMQMLMASGLEQAQGSRDLHEKTSALKIDPTDKYQWLPLKGWWSMDVDAREASRDNTTTRTSSYRSKLSPGNISCSR